MEAQHNVKILKEAEKEAREKVEQAKRQRDQIMRQSDEEARQEIEQFRAEQNSHLLELENSVNEEIKTTSLQYKANTQANLESFQRTLDTKLDSVADLLVKAVITVE